MSKVLFVLSSHGRLGDTGRTTGYYVSEIAHPWEVFKEAGYGMASVSPEGGQPPADFDGVVAFYDDTVQKEFLTSDEGAALIHDTPTPEEIDPEGYDAVFFVGGEGAMWDFPENAALQSIAASIYEGGGVVAAVCHGPAGLTNVRLSNGEYLVHGRHLSSFADDEERAIGLDGVVPFLLESRLRERGAEHTKAAVFQPHAVVDGRLVTGQNPASARLVAEHVVEMLEVGAENYESGGA